MISHIATLRSSHLALVYDFVFSCSHSEMICFVVVMVWCFVFKLMYKSQVRCERAGGLNWMAASDHTFITLVLTSYKNRVFPY